MKKITFLLALSAVWLMSAFQTAAAVELCVEGVNSSERCAPVKAKRIIYNCPSGFVLVFGYNGYVCWRESTFSEGKNISVNGYVPNQYDIINQTGFPCEPRNVPQDPETGKCMPASHGGARDYYCQINAYQVTTGGQIYNADDAEEMSRLHTYGTGRYSGWNASISCGDVIPNCDQCNGTLVCSKCDSGYVLQDGKCVDAADSSASDDDSGKTGTVISCPDDMELSADGCCCLTK